MDNRGQTNVLVAAMSAIMGIVGILVFATIWGTIPQDNTSTLSSGAIALLNITDLVLAAIIVIGIVVAVLTVTRG